jgi:SAM-dependent methyltransferase
MVSILFPGRHHMLTNFQYTYLRSIVDQGIDGLKVDKIIFAITSANHSNTRRNPVPLYLRSMAIEKLSRDLGCEVKIYPVPDVQQTEKFAKYIISQIFYQGQEKLTPANTILACSTPDVIKQFRKLKFKNLPAELLDERKNKYSTLRPFEVINILVKSGKNWKNDNNWKKYASSATQDIFLEYNVGDLIIELFSDGLLNEDADITDTRDYGTYAKGMDQNMEFKFNDIKPFICEGKIVDVGCGTGALINLLAKNFPESDIIGIEATRKFYEYCKLQDYSNPFVFFYRRNIMDQNFKNNTINSFIYSSVLHEVYSYIGEKELVKVLEHTHNQLLDGGRIIIRDVVGPEHGEKIVYMDLNSTDGKSSGKINQLSTYHKFFQFVKDFNKRKITYIKTVIKNKTYIKTTLQNAYEYISKMNYTDNWKSEMHEEFGFWSFSDWTKKLNKIGYRVVNGSKTFSSKYIIDKMYTGKVNLYVMNGKNLEKIEYPPTNMILAAEKKQVD